jgi:polynucleotide 5'-kinase involved in rRNA processing
LREGALLAFQDAGGFALGLGVVENADGPEGMVAIRTPLANLEGVGSVRVGAARCELYNTRENWTQ